jgi:hypothetical protein
MAPILFPNDGVVRINPLNANGDFTGEHFRPPFQLTKLTRVDFTPATDVNPAHITFTETYDGSDYEYDADILQFGNRFVTINGRRRTLASAGLPALPDDDWVGTHTT